MSNITTTAAGFTLSQIAALFEADEWQVSLSAADEDNFDADEPEWDGQGPDDYLDDEYAPRWWHNI